MSNIAAIGIDIGGTKIAAGLVTPAGELSHLRSTATPSHLGAQAILDAVVQAVNALRQMAKQEGVEVVGVGVGAGGQIEVPRGRVTYASAVIPNWQGTEIVADLQSRLQLPIAADNDVNVMALGEHRFGAGRGYESALFIAVGTGIGGAVVINDKLYRGHNFCAGDVAHLLVEPNQGRLCNCGQYGHLEAYAAGPAMAQHYAELCSLPAPLPLQEVATRAVQGDAIARAVIEEGATLLGRTLIGAINLFDPEALIMGGGVASLGELWWQPLLQALRSNPLPGPAQLPIHPAKLGPLAAVVGAAALLW